MTFVELNSAISAFGFSASDRPTMAQIKRRHRELVKAHHPDLYTPGNTEEILKINAAAAILMTYLRAYRFSFSEEEFYLQNPEERLRVQFADDPVCGGS